jgi:hypothetical protein
MPFYYDIKVPDLGSQVANDKYIFVKWLVLDKSDLEEGSGFALLSDGKSQYLLRTAGPGFFSQWEIHEGEKIALGQTIGRITTDGELIPYGRPYVSFNRMVPDRP